jgi:hypothetical protein
MSNSAESQEIQLTSMAPDIIREYVILSRRSACVTKATCRREEQVDGPDHHKWVIYLDAINLACKVKGWKGGPYCSIIAKIVMNKQTLSSNVGSSIQVGRCCLPSSSSTTTGLLQRCHQHCHRCDFTYKRTCGVLLFVFSSCSTSTMFSCCLFSFILLFSTSSMFELHVVVASTVMFNIVKLIIKIVTNYPT